MVFFLNFFTDKPINTIIGRKIDEDVNYFVRKIGQYPPYEKTLSKELINFLTKEDKDLYKKAVMNLSTGYGIGAFAYFRRIVENEIDRIVHKFSGLDRPESEEIKKQFKMYQKHHQKDKLIEAVFPYLPSSLKELGNNPLKYLNRELSVGIHALSDEDCLERAAKIQKVLEYVITTYNRESSEVSSVRKILGE